MESSTRVLDTQRKKGRETSPRRSASPAAGGPVTPSPRPRANRCLRSDKPVRAAIVLVGLILVAAVAAPLLSPSSPDAIDPGQKLLAPSPEHPFGTDDMGRDLFVRVMRGGRASVTVGIIAVLSSLAIGIMGGGLAGYFGGFADALVMRLVDVMLALPVFLIVLLCASLFSPGLLSLCLLIGSVQWMEVARVVRSVVISTRDLEFVESARALGLSDTRILFHHILPHTSGPVLVAGTLGLAQAIVIESTLSFLGFGLQPPSATWGSLLRDAQGYLSSAPWIAVFPGLMIFATVLCCYVIGDFLRRAADPRSVARSLALRF